MISGLSSLPLGAARQSDTIFWVMPVASSVSSRTEMPEVRSTNFARARRLGDDRQGVGVPLEQLVAARDLLALLDEAAASRSPA
jgi:hypothetical protein